jgi:hypothetical protein
VRASLHGQDCILHAGVDNSCNMHVIGLFDDVGEDTGRAICNHLSGRLQCIGQPFQAGTGTEFRNDLRSKPNGAESCFSYFERRAGARVRLESLTCEFMHSAFRVGQVAIRRDHSDRHRILQLTAPYPLATWFSHRHGSCLQKSQVQVDTDLSHTAGTVGCLLSWGESQQRVSLDPIGKERMP